ncbi:uncharacterized protein LOC127865621 [Dreissena polymorpha]|uniref:Uncharacterized protein n=1 Tax=Dreissena polymorpha TaxID=45954 RepID=A0A9D4RAG9_DREPO|nr:uncharacterized protein LOC127865621 [Dreissena polymorpha]XP_052261470.1 uncharacterized protein LOC127865621 [Dreissena polymorpha]KAH3860263.1 hypothetical protein DPMN_023157 [Dreissena polymorpha]
MRTLALLLLLCFVAVERVHTRSTTSGGPQVESQDDDVIGFYQDDDTFDFTIEDEDDVADDDEAADMEIGKTKCHRGICKICHRYRKIKACVVAKATRRGMGLGLVVNHHIILKGRLRNGHPICSRHVPRFPAVKSVCLVPSYVDTRKQAACVNVTAEVRDRKYNRCVGCFRIPRDDSEALPELQSLFTALSQGFVTSGDATSGGDAITDDRKIDDETLRLEGHL